MKGYQSRDIKGLKESGAHPEDLNAWEASTLHLDEARSHELVIEQNCSFILPVFMSGDAYIRFNRPIGQSIKLMKNVMLKFPISKIYISNDAQPGKEIQLILGTPGFDIKPIENVTEITVSPDLPPPGTPSPTPETPSYIVPLIPFSSGKITLNLGIERDKTEYNLHGTFFAIFDHGSVGSNWSIWFNTTDNAELTRANLEKFPSGDFWINKLIVSNPIGSGNLVIYLDYIELPVSPPNWPPDEPPEPPLPDNGTPTLPDPVGPPSWTGLEWEEYATTPAQFNDIIQIPGGYFYAISNTKLYGSGDYGKNWTDLGEIPVTWGYGEHRDLIYLSDDPAGACLLVFTSHHAYDYESGTQSSFIEVRRTYNYGQSWDQIYIFS